MSRKYIQHLRSKQVDTVQEYGLDKQEPKVPVANTEETPDGLMDGEIAINYAKDNEVISIKNEQNDIVKFLNEKVIYDNELITADAIARLKTDINNDLLNIYQAIDEMDSYKAQADWDETDELSSAYIKNKPAIPTKTSELENDSNFITQADIDFPEFVQVQSDWQETDTTSKAFIKNKSIKTLTEYEESTPIAVGDTYDQAFSKINKIIEENERTTSEALTELNDTKVDKDSLAVVATSGSYLDLDNKPRIPLVNDGILTIQKNGENVVTFTANQGSNATANIVVPSKTSELENDSNFITQDDIDFPEFAQVQSDWQETDTTSKAYIKNKPTIPTVNDATLTIQKEGTEIDHFTANSRKDVTVNIVETDPVFKQSAAYGITPQNIRQWNAAEANVQSDWNQTNELEDDYIKNKPVIDTELSNTSTNAVQNKAIQEGLDNIVGYMGELIEPIHTSGSMTYSQWKLLNEKISKHKVLVYDRYPVKVEIVDNSDQGSISPVVPGSDPIEGGKFGTMGNGSDAMTKDGEIAPISTKNEVHIYWFDMYHNYIYELYSSDSIPSTWFKEDDGTVSDDESVTMTLNQCENVTSCNWATKVSSINNNINKKADKTLIVNITKDNTNNTFSFDKTFSELYTAFNNGTNIVAVWDYRTYTTFSVNNAAIVFYTLSPEEGVISGFELYSDDSNEHYSRMTLQDVDYSHLFYSATIDDLMIGKIGTPVEGQYMPYMALTAANQQLNKTRYAGVYAVLEEGSEDVIDHLVLSKTDTPPEGSVMVYFKRTDFTDKSLVLDAEHTVAMSYQTEDDTVPYKENMDISVWDAAAASPNSMFVPKRYSELFEYGYINYEQSDSNAIVFFDKNGNVISDSVINTSQFAGGINNVEVVGDKLVVTYNLGDGTTKTVEIPLGDLFDPDDYYTTTQVDSKIAAVSHYDATWLITNDGSAEEYTYEYTVSDTRYNDLVAAINAKKLIFAKTSNKEVYFNVFTDNNDYILMQFIQNNRRMNYHVYRTNNDGVHTVQKRRADFAYNDNVYSKQDVYTKSETDDKFVGSLVVQLASASIDDGTTFQTVYDALLAGKHVVYVNNGSQYYTVERFDSTAIHLKSFSIYSNEWLFVIDNLVHTPANDNDPQLQYYYRLLPTVQHLSARTQSNEGASGIGYYSGGNTYITNANTVSAALGKVDTLINTISTDLDSVNNSLSTLNNNISAVDNSSRVFRVGYNPSNTSTLYKWNNSQWEAYDETQEAYNALVTAHTQGRVIQIIGFDNENNQNDGSIYSLQYFNETAVSAPTGSNLSTFNMLFYCHCVVTRSSGTTQINRIYLYMNENGSFQTVIENN